MPSPNVSARSALVKGALVRCEYREGHVGELLAVDDPRAWAGTIAFPFPGLPDAELVRAHVVRHGIPNDDKLPVLWHSFPEPRVYWDSRLSPWSEP